ncbi:hypothetical protein [Myxacorys almedinensis]|uniref:hypothetical protein n=1 Tax=Myxacorys almedinensis TaxID=2651157 RepID=UPI0013914135|nr:hypothetical protein [Myxacorys almedinensis]
MLNAIAGLQNAPRSSIWAQISHRYSKPILFQADVAQPAMTCYASNRLIAYS